MNGISSLYIRKFARKLEQYNKPMSLPEYFRPMIGGKKHVKIAEVGAGPICTIGEVWDGVKVEIWASDILANEYRNQLWIPSKETPLIPVQYQNMENLVYADESFDIVHCVNALDHTQDVARAVAELIRICKTGGWIYLRHSPNQKKRFERHHYWNCSTDADICFSLFENEETIYWLPDSFNIHIEDGLIVAKCQKT